jgi:glycosyltransferase involved in cell wall biosynthesis
VTESRLRIAHVSTETGFSGGEVQVFLLMDGLRARGHTNLLVCPPGSRAEARARECDFDVACVPMRNDLSLGAARAIARLLRETRPALVHCHTGRANWLGGLAAARAGIPALSTRRMDRRVKRGWRTRWLYRSLMRRVAAISPAVAKRLRDAGVPPDRIRLIWSAVDPSALTPSAPRAALRERMDAAPTTQCVLVAANLVQRKGVDVLLTALTRGVSAGSVLWIAGDGPERTALEEQASRLGVSERVRFLGRRDDVPDLLEACDVFVLPSRQEGLGVAALEAMARGRPVVATSVGGLAEVVTPGECGLLVPPDDADALAAALERLIGDPEFATRLGAAGARRVEERFVADSMIASYEILYREILAEARGGAGRAGAEEP